MILFTSNPPARPGMKLLTDGICTGCHISFNKGGIIYFFDKAIEAGRVPIFNTPARAFHKRSKKKITMQKIINGLFTKRIKR